jgi:hypothetical protein
MQTRAIPDFLWTSLLTLCLAAHLVPTGAAASQAEPVPVEAPPPVTADDIDQAIHRAVRFLLARQELDGSWRPDERKYLSGQTGHCVYTLIKAGVPTSHPAIERGLAYLCANPPRLTYGIACSLLAVHAADPERYLPQIEEWTETLLGAHGTGFGYPGSEHFNNYAEDLSLTQYGALGLRVAEASGLEVHHEIWSDLISYALSVSNDDGSFSYHAGWPHTGSMTAAGVAVLQIAMDALEAQNRIGVREARQINERIEQAYAWLGEHMRMDRNPDPQSENDGAGHMTRWALYYLYGLERVGGLTGERTFGERDWYKEASEFLVRNQGGEGQWGTLNGEPHPGTCFGVLVLKRATAPSSGVKPRNKPTYGDDKPARPMSMRIAGDTPLTAWISSFGDKTLKKFEWDEDIGQGPRVIRVEYVNVETEEVLAVQAGNPDEPAKKGRFGVQFSMDQPGVFRIQAHALIRPIDDEDGEEILVKSQIIDVSVDAAQSQGMRDATHDLTLNALRQTVCTATASSFATDSQVPRFAVDGSTCYPWLSKPDDEERWIEVEPDRPQRGDFVVLTPATFKPDKRTHWGRPALVFVHVNGKKVGEFPMHPDPFAKTYIPLKKKTVVRKIRVEILETTPGTDAGHGAASGFAEVELQLRPDLRKKLKRK